MAKSVIPPSPRGLNVIAEYTLIYDLPASFQILKTIQRKTKYNLLSTTTAPHSHLYRYDVIVPYSHHYSQYLHSKSHSIKRNHFKKKLLAQKCLRQNLYDHYIRRYSKVCLKRYKRNEKNSVDMTRLTVSQRIFYDLIEKWSLL